MTNASAFKPKGSDLDVADDREYQDMMVGWGFRDGGVWTLLLEEERVDRTLEMLRNTKSSIEQQLGHANRTQDGGDPDWRKRALNLLRLVNTHLADAKDEVQRLDKEEQRESAEGERDEWKRICGLLVDLFHDNPALKFITLPANNMTAAEWATLRAEKTSSAMIQEEKVAA